MSETSQHKIGLLAIGEALIDLISTEPADRLEEAPLFRRFQGGSPANLAVNVARLGGRSALVARAGDDAFGRYFKSTLQACGVDTRYFTLDPAWQTSLVFVARTSGTPDFQPYRSADYHLFPDDLPKQALANAQVVHTTTWPLSREPARSTVLQWMRQARAAGAIISFDPNYSPLVWPEREEALQVMRQLFEVVTLVKASLDDAQRLFGPGQAPTEYIRRFHDLGPQVVVFTLGKEGSLLSEGGRLVGRLPSRKIAVVDATGAGDAFWSGFLAALLDGSNYPTSLLFAREVVEIKLKTMGALPNELSRSEIYARLGESGQEFQPA